MKLQPNFSWQKYEGDEQNQKNQFQYQLQQQHILVANSLNATINDASYFSQERMTSFTWTDGQPIWKKTVTGLINASGDNPVNLNVTGINIVTQLEGSMQNAVPMTTFAMPLPYVDPVTLANGVGLYVTPTQVHVVAGNASWVGYTFNVTIYYTKVR